MVPAIEAPPEVLADVDIELAARAVRDLLTDRARFTAERYSDFVHRAVKQLTG